MDWPDITMAKPSHINSYSAYTAGGSLCQLANLATPASSTWIGASTAIYIPLWIPWPYVVNRAFWVNGATVTGNVDMGIYTPGGARVWSSGSTVQSGASAAQYVTASGVELSAGAYFLAYANDGTTTRVFGSAVTAINGRASGLYQQATALPLPTSATFAQWAGTIYPLVGITETTTGF